jgi:sRNA-binding carbon storage regulator CsrA
LWQGVESVFVLSRRIGESVVFDNAVVATVAVVGAEFVDLSLAKIDGTRLGRVTLDVQQLRPVVQGVAGVMVKRLSENSIRLGFEVDESMTVARSTH